MTIAQFCDKYGISHSKEGLVEQIIRNCTDIPVKKNIVGNIVVNDDYAEQYYELWKQFEQRQREREQQREIERDIIQQEEARIEELRRIMPITSTNTFQGYRIVEYGGYVSGDEAIELSDGLFGGTGDFQKDTINEAIKAMRATAIDELKTAAAQIGCNAVVGLDFDYVTIDRTAPGLTSHDQHRTFIILTANGTAVTIEPE